MPDHKQVILRAENHYRMLDDYFAENRVRKIFLVCDSSILKMAVNAYFEELPSRFGIEVTRFSEFSPNPVYESVVAGVEAFRRSGAKDIVAVGGGSALDVAKCVKLFSEMDPGENYLRQTIVPNDIRLLAMPTTAGTGSEATRFAVVYEHGEKKSVNHLSAIPNAVLFDPGVLLTLPEYQKKSTMLDALCHAIESMWSVNATEESRNYAQQAIALFLRYSRDYLRGDSKSCEQMLLAANLAGKAINISQTTAGHAMCYKLTSLYGLAHGHAAALCVEKLWPFMILTAEQAPEKNSTLCEVFRYLADAFSCSTSAKAAECFSEILRELALQRPAVKESDLEILSCSVNEERLKNNPVPLDKSTIRMLYREIIGL